MLKQHIKFKDFNGEDAEADLYFNLTEAELVEMQADSENGIQQDMLDAVRSKDMRKLLDFVKMLVVGAYGERDRDGIHFNKSPEITARFINSAMYSPLLMSLFEEEGARTEAFITGLMPQDLVARAIAQSNGQGNTPRPSRVEPQDFRRKEQPAPVVANGPGVTEAPEIGSRPFENNSDQTPTPSTWSGTDEPAPQPFRIQEEPMDALGNVIQDPEEAAAYAEFKRRRDAGEL